MILVKFKETITSIINSLIESTTGAQIDESKVEEVLSKYEFELYSIGLTPEAFDILKDKLKSRLCGLKLERGVKAKSYIKNQIKNLIIDTLRTPKVELAREIKVINAEKNKPALLLFLGFNGVGKSITICKLGKILKKKGFRVLLAAGDTFRSAAIEQLTRYAEMAGLPVVKSKRGADSCSVIYQAMEKAKSKKYNVVIADTAGRSHLNVNLMDELKKIVRVNKPDFKILVLDSLTGSDITAQFKQFEKELGVDYLIFTKFDANPEFGGILSVLLTSRKPIIYVGTGSGIDDIKDYEPEDIASSILEW